MRRRRWLRTVGAPQLQCGARQPRRAARALHAREARAAAPAPTDAAALASSRQAATRGGGGWTVTPAQRFTRESPRTVRHAAHTRARPMTCTPPPQQHTRSS
jgi:hypothetical protein